MNNVDLFSFTFIDREKQTQRVKDILGKKNFKNVIWIYGNNGVGKSYFVKHATSEVTDNMMVHIELKANNKTTNCLGLLLDKIGNVTHSPFMSFFQKNYKVISKLMLCAVCTAIQNITKIDYYTSHLLTLQYFTTPKSRNWMFLFFFLVFSECRAYRATPKGCIFCPIASQYVISSHRSRRIRVNIFEKRYSDTGKQKDHLHIPTY